MADDKENSVEDLEDEKQEELTGTAGQASKDMQSMAADPAFQSALDLEQDEIGQMKELDVSKAAAEKALRENQGSLETTLRALIA
ncbi:hypothetical protein HDU99_009815 [Rhizoclosmatium hyalinum]|nr:hypothetical protein HDU99_009815 [Rhizoclosmatium hyalinum]